MKKNLLLFTFMFFITLLASNSVIAQCTYGAPTVVATVAAPTTVGATITSPAMTSGQVYRVTGMVSGAVYRVYNCGSGFDTQITIYPSGGGADEGYNDDNGPECTGSTAASINYACTLSGTKDIKLNLYNCLSSGNPGTITVRLVSMPFVPCIASTNQGVITPTGTYQMTASVPAGAAHYWSATLTAGVSYTFSNCVAEGGTAEDTYLRIYDATGAVVATADDVCSTNALVIYTPGTTGTYYIGLTHYSCSFLSLSQKISYRITPFDPCSSITASNACGVTNTTVIGAGSDGVYNPPATSCGYSTPGREKIYTFTPSTSGLHQIAQSASFYYIDYFFKASSGGCTGTGWTCIKDLNGAATSATATFVLTAGTQYYILLDPENSAGGTVSFSIVCPAACGTPTSAAATSVTTTTATANWTCASCTGTYIIEYGLTGFTPGTGAGAGSGSSTVVTAIAGATSKGLTGLTSGSNYQYYVRQVCSGPLYSSNSTVQAFSTLVPPPANDNVCSATALAVTGSSPYNFSFGPYSNANSTTEVGEPMPPATGFVTQTGWWINDLSNTIWFTLTVPTCGLYSIETDNFDTQIALYSAASCSAVLSGGSTLLAANDDYPGSSPYDSKIIDVALQSGVTYYLQLDSYSAGVTGSTPIKVTGVASAIPAITSASAVSPYVCPGATTTLNANGVGGDGAVVTWWTGMGGTGTNLGTGTSLPGMGTGTYYARVTGNCSPPIEASVTVTGLDPAMATVPASDGTTRTADKECSDGTWTDYYQGNNILLSIKKNGQTIGTVGDGNFFVRQKGSSGFSPISNLWPDNYCNTTNWKVMNRYWDVTTVTQPAAGVNVRFYYTTADYDAVKNALAVATPPRTITSHSQLLFYKINDLLPSGYNIDPTGGHTNIPIATGYGADGYYEYLHGGTPGTAAWTYSAFGAAHYGEYTVSKFSGGGGGGGNSGGAFPIELLYFSGHAEANTNIIEWATATEKNNQYQIVERSVNGIDDWTEVGRKAGAGNSTDPIAYKLSDAAPLALGYYRLRAVDFDGTEQISEVISIQRESDVFAIVNAFPVPVDKEVTLLVNTPVSGDVDIMVTDIIGKLLYKSSTTLTKGVNEVKIDMETLPAGTYTITLDNGKARAMKQIVK